MTETKRFRGMEMGRPTFIGDHPELDAIDLDMAFAERAPGKRYGIRSGLAGWWDRFRCRLVGHDPAARYYNSGRAVFRPQDYFCKRCGASPLT